MCWDMEHFLPDRWIKVISAAEAASEMEVTITNTNFSWYLYQYKCIWKVLIRTLMNRTFTYRTVFENFNYALSRSEYSCLCSCCDSLLFCLYLKFKCALCICVLHIKMQIQYSVHRRCFLRFSSPFITLQKYLRFFPSTKKNTKHNNFYNTIYVD